MQSPDLPLADAPVERPEAGSGDPLRAATWRTNVFSDRDGQAACWIVAELYKYQMPTKASSDCRRTGERASTMGTAQSSPPDRAGFSLGRSTGLVA
ncbi:hypothetical protein GCM10023196_050770 [Actinoallomurus vinaceus]|uniref:Uncharacterized protein n=1 Tax=Actinoallomurus vinaceus TaxID=1080074 RepID=A0ABP8UG24_9ACTN